MKYLLSLSLLVFPLFIGATLPDSVSLRGLKTSVFLSQSNQTIERPPLFERLTGKFFQKRLGKVIAPSNDSNGKRLSNAGFTIGWLVTIFFPLSFALAATYGLVFLILYLLVSLTGLYLSILGLRKARGQENTRRIKRRAIIGIILNSIFFMLAALILNWAIG